jgi:hypothetical protein
MSHEPYDLWEEYVELNEQIGQAVMATLAIACAEGQGSTLSVTPDRAHCTTAW